MCIPGQKRRFVTGPRPFSCMSFPTSSTTSPSPVVPTRSVSPARPGHSAAHPVCETSVWRTAVASATRKTAKQGENRALRDPRAGSSRLVLLGLLALALGSFVVGAKVGRQLVRLDRMVTQRFNGQRFRVPSRVLSAPTILYPGLDWKNVDLPGALTRLGYQPETGPGPLLPGRYVFGKNKLHVHLRALEHPTRPEPDRDVEISFEESEISEIRDVAT